MPQWLRHFAHGCAMLGCAVACLVAMLTVVSIVGRTFWSWPIPGDVELTQFGIALCIALCLPWCQLQRGNIIVDFFTQRSGPSTKRWLDGFGSLLLAVMVGLLAWRSAAGALAVGEANETTMILGLPMWVSYAALAPGLALTSLIALLQVFTGVEVRE
ncbi:MAG: TRAP transporter small permease [Burkholderiaceae bacterium]|nr:TRAP transporter small permease [Burkholderiaceae bacterium]